MSAIAIKVAPDLAAAARLAAGESDRSVAGQLEHWAKLGRGVEKVLPTHVAAALKRCGAGLSAEEESSAGQRALEALNAVRAMTPDALRSMIGLDQRPYFESDPADSHGVVQVLPDGSRIRGRLDGRKFVPAS